MLNPPGESDNPFITQTDNTFQDEDHHNQYPNPQNHQEQVSSRPLNRTTSETTVIRST